MKDRRYFELGNNNKNMLGFIKEENKYDYDEKDYIFDSNRKNDGHTAVIKQIIDNSEVLDIGCASGLIGKILKEVKHCTVDGIEYDKEAFKVAQSKKIYRDIFNFSISDTTTKNYNTFKELKRKYDFIIFADVLEHLVEPWQVLANISKFLKPNGSIIVSVPNIAHIDIIRGLINGDFNYTELGILDSTHLRFFTASSFADMVKSIGDKNQIYFNIELREKVLIKPTYMNDDKVYELFNFNNNLEEFLVLQNIYKLTLVDAKDKAHVKGISKNNNYFDIINEEYTKILEENNNLKNNNQELQTRLNQIENSKRWKFINKLGNLKNKIFHC